MSSLRVPLAGLALACCCALPTAAAPVAFELHPGLWEMTTSGLASNPAPIPEDMLARLSPERRASFEAALTASRARTAAPHTFRQCITPESLQHGIKVDDSKSERTCQPRVTSSTASIMDMRMECSGPKQTSSGTFRFEAASPNSLAGTIHMTIDADGRSVTINRVIEGKWLAADCGSLKSRDN